HHVSTFPSMRYRRPSSKPSHELLDETWTVRSHKAWPPNHPLTLATSCWFCNAPIFLHTNGHGDSVLLEPPLGPPWEKHQCLSLITIPAVQVQNKASWELGGAQRDELFHRKASESVP